MDRKKNEIVKLEELDGESSKEINKIKISEEVENNLDSSNKCGDIIFKSDLEQFLLNCGFCTSHFYDLVLYSNHFLKEHLNEWNKRNTEVKLENLYSLEEEDETNDLDDTLFDSTNSASKLENANTNNIDYQKEINSPENSSVKSNLDKCDQNLCIICMKRFDSLDQLQKHEKEKNCEKLRKPVSKNNELKSKEVIKHNLETKKCNLKLKSQKCFNQHRKKRQSVLKKNLTKTKASIKFSKEELTCEICGKQLSNISSLLRHKNCHLENSKRPFKCNDCNKGFNTNKHLENHRKIHDEPRIYECDFCFLKFDTMNSKKEHQRKHSYEFKQLVDNIGKRMAIIQQINNGNSENLVAEINYNAPNGYWRCNICDKMFKNSYKQEEHKRFHDNIKPFICELCGKGMASQQVLNYHMLVHKEERRFKCSKCGTGFFTSAHLKRHVQTTCNAEKLFQCEICQYRFTRKEHLIAHSLTHDKNRTKDYKCEYCDASYLTLNSLRVHKKKHIINPEGPFKCNLCAAQFSTKDAVRRHEKRHINKEAYKCDHCERKFNDKVDMQQHMKRQHSSEIKSSICSICNKCCFRKLDLEKHLITHNTS